MIPLLAESIVLSDHTSMRAVSRRIELDSPRGTRIATLGMQKNLCAENDTNRNGWHWAPTGWWWSQRFCFHKGSKARVGAIGGVGID